MTARGLLAVTAVTLAGCVAVGCEKKPQIYSSTVELARVDVLTRPGSNEKTIDVEFDYPQCPGEQVEVIRGDAAFAECLLAKHKVGDRLPVKIRHVKDRDGGWDWDIIEMAGCARPPLEGDEASFDTVQECEPLVMHGMSVGFKCRRIPEKALLAKCPWFARY